MVLAYARRRASRTPPGFLAVYVAGVVLRQRPDPAPAGDCSGFADGLAWLAQIGLFVLLGMLASPSRLPAAVLPALVVGAVLVLRGPAAVGRGERRLVPGGLARAGLPVLGRASRRGADRARHDPAVAQRGRCDATVRRGVRPGRDLHGGPGQHDPAGGHHAVG